MINTTYLVELEAAIIGIRAGLAEVSNLLKGGTYKLSPGGPLSDCAGTLKIHVDRLVEEAQRCSQSLALSRGEVDHANQT
jgi:hypothetical protein